MIMPKKKSVNIVSHTLANNNLHYNAKSLLLQAHTAILQVLALLLLMAKISDSTKLW